MKWSGIIAVAAAVCLSVNASAQQTRTAKGTEIYVIPKNMTLDRAEAVAVEQAKLRIIADNFGTIVGSSSTMTLSNKNGVSQSEIFTFGETEVKGEWLETLDGPHVERKVVNKKVIKEKIKPVQKDDGGFLIMGTYSTIGMCGLRMGYVKKFGGYLSYSDTFYDGMLNQWSATLGGMVRAASWLYPYVGAGFGWLYWPEYGGHYSYGMVPVEVGAMLKFGPVTLSAAVEPNYVFNKGVLCSFEFGVGFCF